MDKKVEKYLESLSKEQIERLANQDVVVMCMKDNLDDLDSIFKKYGLSIIVNAKWIGQEEHGEYHTIYRECSNCHMVRQADKFCSNCGARMEKG